MPIKKHSTLKRSTLLVVFSATTLLSACSTLDEWSAEQYHDKCISLGINPNSPSFDECILQQQKLDEEGIQHSMDRSAMGKKHHH